MPRPPLYPRALYHTVVVKLMKRHLLSLIHLDSGVGRTQVLRSGCGRRLKARASTGQPPWPVADLAAPGPPPDPSRPRVTSPHRPDLVLLKRPSVTLLADGWRCLAARRRGTQ